MADIAVVHDSLAAGGGAEAVGVHTLGALAARGHDVTLYTDRDVDLAAVCEYHGTARPSGVDVRVAAPYAGRFVRRLVDGLTAVSRAGDLPLLRRAVVNRAFERRGTDHDAVVSTHGEFWSDACTVQYVHFPYYSARAMRTNTVRFSESLYPTYHRVCRAVERPGRVASAGSPPRTLACSEWVADVVEDAYGVAPTVVHPPVAVRAFEPPAWEEMEDGFVAVGRLHPLKRHHEAIEVVDELRADGVETHLHVVGGGGTAAYRERLRELAADRPYVHLEGRLERAALVDLLERHRYGIHARRREPFGIVVAEMVAAGSVPVVHDSGGQTEVVAGLDELTYQSTGDAVDRVAAVVRGEVDREALRRTLEQHVEGYRVDRFRREIVSSVRRLL